MVRWARCSALRELSYQPQLNLVGVATRLIGWSSLLAFLKVSFVA